MTLRILKEELKEELLDHILPFWISKMTDHKGGGFYGEIDFKGMIRPEAPRGGILNARILWTFSRAFGTFRNPEYHDTAMRAFEYLTAGFLDMEYGGLYWQLDQYGNPLNTRKQIYVQAFGIYAFSEYYKETGDNNSLAHALSLFRSIEKYSFDSERNGYYEAFSREWGSIADQRLSEKDQNVAKTLNTHLHILEAYTNLYRVFDDEKIKGQLANLCDLFFTKFINSSGHLDLFFEEDWTLTSDLVSFGHDIECSWLLVEAAEVLNDQEKIRLAHQFAVRMAEKALNGLDDSGGLAYEYFPSANRLDSHRHWWVQAEAMVGFFKAYLLSGEIRFLEAVFQTWEFIKRFIIDRENGEWHWSVDDMGKPDSSQVKAGFWKCPYHNGRACMELISRIRE